MIIKIISDLSMRNAGEQMEGCFAGQPNPGVSLNHGRLRRKLFFFPPFVRQRECAAVQCKIQICETVPDKNPAIVQSSMYYWAAHRIQENLARIQIQCRNAGCCRDHNGAINRA